MHRSKDIERRAAWFREHVGVVGKRAKDQAARDLAIAEIAAGELGWECTWEADFEEWDAGDTDYVPTEVLICILRDAEGNPLESLCGIADPSRDYARLVEAELASEAYERFCEQGAADLADRATYAAGGT